MLRWEMAKKRVGATVQSLASTHSLRCWEPFPDLSSIPVLSALPSARGPRHPHRLERSPSTASTSSHFRLIAAPRPLGTVLLLAPARVRSPNGPLQTAPPSAQSEPMGAGGAGRTKLENKL